MIYPEENTRNDVASFIYWFYAHFLGRQPDATHYGAGTRILSGIFKADKKYKNAKVYTLKEAADLLYKLKSAGVAVRSLAILKFPDLLSSSVSDDKEEFDRIVDYLRGEQGVEGKEEWSAVPDGW